METTDWTLICLGFGIVAVIAAVIGRKRSKTMLRINEESLINAKKLVQKALHLMDSKPGLMREGDLPASKEKVKRATQMLAYFYYKKGMSEDLHSIKDCYIGLHRFQPPMDDEDVRKTIAAREMEKLEKEFRTFLKQLPVQNVKMG